MNIGLIGTAIFDEKQEHTISALLTSPVSDDEYLAAEVTTAILNSLVTLAFVTATVWLLKDVASPLGRLAATPDHRDRPPRDGGHRIVFGAKDFTTIMLRGVVYMFVVWLPGLFILFGLIPENVVVYLLVLPPVSAARLLTAGIATVAGWQLANGYLYLLLLCAVVYPGVVRSGFQRYVVREIGV